MASKSNPCANQKSTGCPNFVTQRGTTLCDICIETKKKTRENDYADKMRVIEQERILLKKQLENIESKYKDLCSDHKNCLDKIDKLEKEKNDNKTSEVLEFHYEKENIRLNSFIDELRNDITKLQNERAVYEITHNQLKLDNEHLLLQISTLKSQVEKLTSDIKLLTEENNSYNSKM